MYFNIANASSSVHHWKLLAGVGGREREEFKKRREPEITLEIVDWQLSGIFSANTGFHNTLDGYLLLLGNSSCVKSSKGLKKNHETEQKEKTNMHRFPANYCKEKW